MPLDFPANPVDGQTYDNFIYNSAKGTWKSLSSGASPSILVNPTITNAVITATAPNATTVPVTVKGAASQSANLQEWKNSSNVVSSRITSYGSLHTPTLGVGLLNPPDTGGEVVLQTYGRQRINSDGTNSAGIWFTGVGGSDLAFFGGTSTTGSDPIGIYHNGAWRMQVDSSGRMKVPYQPSFHATAPDTSWTNTTTNTDMTNFSVAVHNNGSHYNTSTGRFTAPVNGYYFFSISIFMYTAYANNTNTYWGLYKNGNGINVNVHGTQGQDGGQSISGVYYLAAGDYISIRHNSSLASWGGQFCSFNGHLLG